MQKKNRTKDQRLKENINKLKDNQSQLVMLIKLIEENGIDAEGIIDKWNEQMSAYLEGDDVEERIEDLAAYMAEMGI